MIIYSLTGVVFGNSFNTGHYFVELVFKPIEKEFFTVDITKYSFRKNIKFYIQSDSLKKDPKNFREQPLITS